MPATGPPVPRMVAPCPWHWASSHSSVNVPVLPLFPSIAILYVVPARTFRLADVDPEPTVVSAPRLEPV